MTKFYLQNSEAKLGTRMTWWGHGNYTTDLDAAKIFTQEEAVGHHQEREAFIPWPADFVYPKAHSAVDCQYVREQDLTILPSDTPCYVQLMSRWDGNDLYWETADGGFNANLDRAQVITLAEAFTRYGTVDRANSRTIWPKAYIDGKARKVAHQLEMNITDALVGTEIALIQRPVNKPRHTCSDCGRFLSKFQFWHSCPNCSASIRP
ncbi:hypothetical protein [Pseudomonas baetica]|uniref:hypothetical protein n=1 Tax=Pseudomonas baetica TaxID=674054 RepID=UPI0024071911|nr:hypothetical protein [Pseudomonas baetica]MDF9779102.1 hypothetical protein [Pseudomonas baetica]